MKNLITEVDFAAFKNDFDALCDNVNNRREAAALCLESGRKVFILPEDNYDKVSHFIVKSVSANSLTR
ncbi:MAG: hypothetical protein LUE96_03395 [Lachnospiraceae bacterium]|nr:hypothetical protein [Lachnospiraceae bacterium]